MRSASRPPSLRRRGRGYCSNRHHRGYSRERGNSPEVFMAKYVLPDLDYDYSALEPQISAPLLELHQSNFTQGGAPLMVIDAWEHAYYLQYKNQKQAFFEAVWNLWNWSDIEARFVAARAIDLRVPQTVG